MKFIVGEPKENPNLFENDTSWVVVPIQNSLLGAIILGLALTAVMDLIINICGYAFDFSVLKKIYLFLLVFPIHEFIHALCLPKPLNTTFGFVPKKFIFFATTNGCMKRNRLLLTCLAPTLVLSVIPFFLFIFFSSNELFLYIALFNLLGSGGDLLSVFGLLKMPKKSLYRFNGTKLFYKQLTN